MAKELEETYPKNARKTLTIVKSALKSVPSLEKHTMEEILECESLCTELLSKVLEHKKDNKEKYVTELKRMLAMAESI